MNVNSFLIMLLVSGAVFAQSPGDPLKEATQKRQNIFQAVTVEFSIAETVPAGAISRNDSMFGKSKIVPEKETVIESKNRIDFDHSKVKTTLTHPIFFAPGGELVPQNIEAYFDGQVAKLFYPKGVKDEGKSSGIIEQAPRQEMTHHNLFLPMVMFFRGADMAISPYPIGQFQPTGTKLSIAGVECREYSLGTSTSSSQRIWVESGSDYVIRRMQKQKKGKIVEQVDISYRRDPINGAIPDAWTSTRYSADGTIASSVKGQVIEIQANPKFESGHFDVLFPDGAEVFDQRNSKFYRVKPDGSMRELAQDGSELSVSEYQPGMPWYRRNQWLILAAIVVFLGLVARLRSRLSR